mmetsp:Transcript_72551/g.225394  ORF Transcript_72551/g.225394 Transcript_72551/m.225394 type:complete len:698 (+) Transcript_72551:37-2130(+)
MAAKRGPGRPRSLLGELRPLLPLLEELVRAVLQPPHLEPQVDLDEVAAEEEVLVDPGVLAALHGLPLVPLEDPQQHADVRAAAVEDRALRQLHVHVQVLEVEAEARHLLVLVDEELDQLLLVLLHELGLGAHPAVAQAAGNGAVADAAPVEQPADGLALVVLPVEGVVDLGVGVAEREELGDGGHVELHLAAVLGHVARLLDELLQELLLREFLGEGLRGRVRDKLHAHVLEALGHVGREAHAGRGPHHPRVGRQHLHDGAVALARVVAAGAAHGAEDVHLEAQGALVHEDLLDLLRLLPDHPVPAEELGQGLGVGVVEVRAVARQRPVPVLLGGGVVLAGVDGHRAGLGVGHALHDVDEVRGPPAHVAEVHARGAEGQLAEAPAEDVVEGHLAPVHAEARHGVLVALVLAREFKGHLDEHTLREVPWPVLVFDGQKDLAARAAPHVLVVGTLLRDVTGLHLELLEPHDLVVWRQGAGSVHGLGQPRRAPLLQLLGRAGEGDVPELARLVPLHQLLELLHARRPAAQASLGVVPPPLLAHGLEGRLLCVSEVDETFKVVVACGLRPSLLSPALRFLLCLALGQRRRLALSLLPCPLLGLLSRLGLARWPRQPLGLLGLRCKALPLLRCYLLERPPVLGLELLDCLRPLITIVVAQTELTGLAIHGHKHDACAASHDVLHAEAGSYSDGPGRALLLNA